MNRLYSYEEVRKRFSEDREKFLMRKKDDTDLEEEEDEEEGEEEGEVSSGYK